MSIILAYLTVRQGHFVFELKSMNLIARSEILLCTQSTWILKSHNMVIVYSKSFMVRRKRAYRRNARLEPSKFRPSSLNVIVMANDKISFTPTTNFCYWWEHNLREMPIIFKQVFPYRLAVVVVFLGKPH